MDIKYKFSSRITVLLIWVLLCPLAVGQSTNDVNRYDISWRNIPVAVAMDSLVQVAGIGTEFSSKIGKKRITCSLERVALETILTECMIGNGILYELEGETVALYGKASSPHYFLITGEVVNELGPLAGANVYVVGSSPLIGSATDSTGIFRIKAPRHKLGSLQLEATYMGLDTAHISLRGSFEDALDVGTFKLNQRIAELPAIDITDETDRVENISALDNNQIERLPEFKGDVEPIRFVTSSKGGKALDGDTDSENEGNRYLTTFLSQKIKFTEQSVGFGTSVDISGDFIVVGAKNNLFAFKKKKDANEWQRLIGPNPFMNYTVPSDDKKDCSSACIPTETTKCASLCNHSWLSPAGYSVAVKGSTILAGLSHTVFESWEKEESVRYFGGNAILYDTESASLNQNNPFGNQEFLGPLPPPVSTEEVSEQEPVQDCFGCAIALSNEYVLVGDPHSSTVIPFKRSLSGLERYPNIKESNHFVGSRFGSSIAIDNNVMVIGAPGCDDESCSGSAYVFELKESGWEELVQLTPADHPFVSGFGSTVAISDKYAAISATINSPVRDTSVVFTYERKNGIWEETTILKQDIYLIANGKWYYDHRFGESLAIGNDIIVVGAPTDSLNLLSTNPVRTEGGSITVYGKRGTEWVEQMGYSYSTLNGYGASMAIEGNILVVGAPSESGGFVQVYDISKYDPYPRTRTRTRTRTQSIQLENYPNPFSKETIFKYSISEPASVVQFSIFDILGRQILLQSGLDNTPGTHTIQWKGQGSDGASVSSGVYIYSLTVDGEKKDGKVAFIR